MNTVIFDTNLLLDFFVFKDPKTSVLWEAAKERKVRTATCDGAVSELEDVLKRPQFKVTSEQLEVIKEEFLIVGNLAMFRTEYRSRRKQKQDAKILWIRSSLTSH